MSKSKDMGVTKTNQPKLSTKEKKEKKKAKLATKGNTISI